MSTPKEVKVPLTVRATALGFDGLQRRREGDVFTLPDSKLFSEKWMEKVEAAEPAPAKPVLPVKPAVLRPTNQPAQPHNIPAEPAKGAPTGAAAVIG